MKTLTKEQVLYLHAELIEEFGGTDGIRDMGLLESAMYAPFQTFGGEALYPSVQAKAAKLGLGIVGNHPFLDGNKRTGAHVMLIFLALNGIELEYTQEELTRKAHNYELERSPYTVLCLDYAQSGIGSNSCGPELLEQYRLDAQHFVFEIGLRMREK